MEENVDVAEERGNTDTETLEQAIKISCRCPSHLPLTRLAVKEAVAAATTFAA